MLTATAVQVYGGLVSYKILICGLRQQTDSDVLTKTTNKAVLLNNLKILSECEEKEKVSIISLTLACEQQTRFRSSLLSLRNIFRRERSDDRKCFCCSQASLTPDIVRINYPAVLVHRKATNPS